MHTGSRAPGSHINTIAAWLFVLPLLAIGVLPDVTKIQGAGIVVLAFAMVVIHRSPIPRRGAAVIYVTFAVLSLLLIGHLMFGHWQAFAGTTSSYDHHALIFIGMYMVVAMYAGIFYHEDVFGRVVWRGATVALWIGVIIDLVSRLTGQLFLVNPNAGALRMTGTLEEPSAWAAPLTVVLLLALRRRSKFYVALALAGLLLADSPTCMLVMGVTVPAYFALTRRSRHGVLIRAGFAGAFIAGVLFVQHADYQHYIASTNAAERSVGRLVSGIRNVESGGVEGQNTRFWSAQIILEQVRKNGWERYGVGLAADSTYLAAVYPQWAGPAASSNSLWLTVLFDLGEGGVMVLGLLALMALWHMRERPAAAAVFLPFLVSASVNGGGPDSQMAVLAIMLFVPGWQALRSRTAQHVPGARGDPASWRAAPPTVTIMNM